MGRQRKVKLLEILIFWARATAGSRRGAIGQLVVTLGYAINKRICAGQRIVQELSRFPQMKSIVGQRFCLRDQHVLRQFDQGTRPARHVDSVLLVSVGKQIRPARIAMKIEDDFAVSRNDMVARRAVGWTGPDCAESGMFRPSKKSMSKNVARDAGKENAVGMRPLQFGKSLEIALWAIQFALRPFGIAV